MRFGDLPTDQAWHVQNLINSLLIQTTMDGEEGRQAFNEKRKPDFDGKLRKRGDATRVLHVAEVLAGMPGDAAPGRKP